MATTVDNLVLQYTTRGEAGLRRSLQAAAMGLDTVEGKAAAMNIAFNAAIAGGAGVVGVLGLIGKASLKSSGEMQANRVAFQQLLGSATAGNAKIAELQAFAAKTPFSMTGLVDNSKKLLAMGFTAEELIPTMTSLGNAMSALGGNDEMFSRVIYNLGQIRAQGKAYAVDLRQFAMAGINVVDVMAKSTGKRFTQHQLTEIDGEDFIRDFTKGLDMQFGGMIDKMSHTLPGSINNLGDAFERLKIDVGDVFSSDATKFINGTTAMIGKLESLSKNHPGLIKALVYGTAGAGVGAIGIGVMGKLAFIINQTAQAKERLTGATKLDTAAESAKAIVAGREGRAIGEVGRVAEDVASSKIRLAGATGVAAESASLWTRAGRLVGGARRGAMGLAGRAGNFLSAPAFGDMATGASSSIGGAGRYQFLGMGRYRDTLTGKFAGREAALAWNAESAGAGGLRNALGGISNARLLGGAAMGAGVGVQSYQDWKAAGYTTGQAAAAATTTGIGAGLVTMFVPGGAIAIAAGEAIGWGVNKFYNEKLEKQAQGSISDKEMAAAGKMSPAQLAQFYFKKRDEALARGDSTEAQSYLYNANQQQRKAKKQAEAADEAARDAARAKSNQEDATYNKINSIRGAFSNPVVDKSRNDAWTIKLPSSPADKSHRTMKYNANTPAPAYL